MNEETSISYIIPVYNTETEKIKRCIISIEEFNKRIKIKDYEILIINDKSNNEKTIKYKEIFKDYKKIKYFENKVNYGVSYSRNLGIKNANKKYITFVDSDDYLTREYIKNNKIEFKSNIIIFDMYIITRKTIKKYDFNNGKVQWKDALISHLTKSSFTNPVAKFYEKEFLIKNNIKFNEKVIQGEDNLFNIEFLSHKPSVYYYNFPIYVYEFYSLSTAKRWDEKFEQVKNNIKYIYLKRLEILENSNFKNKEEILKEINNQLVESSFGIYLTLIDINDKRKINEYVKQFKEYKIRKKDLKFKQKVYYDIIDKNSNALRLILRSMKNLKNKIKS